MSSSTSGGKPGGQTAYQRQLQGKKSAGKLHASSGFKPRDKSESTEKKRQDGDAIDAIFGFDRYKKVSIISRGVCSGNDRQ
jgi:hypothetical protein